MKLIDYITKNYGTQYRFAKEFGLTKQVVNAMVKHGGYIVIEDEDKINLYVISRCLNKLTKNV